MDVQGFFSAFIDCTERLKAELQQQIVDEINFGRSLFNQRGEQLILAGNTLTFWRTLSHEEKVAVYLSPNYSQGFYSAGSSRFDSLKNSKLG